jgi:hypothetical protein
MCASCLLNACYVTAITSMVLAREEGILKRLRGTPGRHLSWDLRDLVGVNGATVLLDGLIAVVVVTQPGRCRVFVVTAVATGLVFSVVTSAIAWNGPACGSRPGSNTVPGIPRCRS